MTPYSNSKTSEAGAELSDFEFVRVTADTWDAFEDLFGPTGIAGGCWCSHFKLTAREFTKTPPKERHKHVRDLTCRGEPFGIIARLNEHSIAWVAVSPRLTNHKLEKSMIAQVPQDRDLSTTWAVTCFYLRADARRQGLSGKLLQEAIAYAQSEGAEFIEGYPVDVSVGKVGADEKFYGRLDTFLDSGFKLIERRGKRRALVRIAL